MRILFFLLLGVVSASADVTARIYAVNQTTAMDLFGSSYSLGDETITAPVLDWNTTGPYFDDGGGGLSVDLRAYITGGAFVDGASYVFTVDADGAGTINVSLESETLPESTLWDWWLAGWGLGLTVMGWGLTLRVIKGLRGPGAGEI